MVNRWRDRDPEAGITIVEVTIASAILLGIMAFAMSSLFTAQSGQEFARRRSQSLDELRLGAAAFSRDARQAKSAEVQKLTAAGVLTPTPPVGCTETSTTKCGTKLVFDTFVSGSPVHLVTWEFKEWPTGSGKIRLTRTHAGGTRAFADDLESAHATTGASYFRYTEDPCQTCDRSPTLTLQLNAKQRNQDPIIGLRTKVAFRNE